MKIIYCLLFCLVSAKSHAQEAQKNALQWGMTLGIETQTLGVEPLDKNDPEQPWADPDRNKPGVTIGVVAKKKIWRGLAFQSGSSLSCTYNQIDFHPGGAKRFQFTDLELPLYLTATNQNKRKLPISAKVLFGPRASWNIAANSDTRLRFYRERLALDLGLGGEIDLGKWKLCPEAIYSHGLNNIHDFVGTDFDFWIGRAIRDKVCFRVVLLRAK